MRKRSVGLVFLAVAACSASPRLPRKASGEAVLEVRGAVKNGPFALGRADLDRLPRGAVRGLDPAGGAEATFEGVAVADVLTERVKVADGADTVIVRTADKAAIPVPLTMIRQWRPVLADRVDGVRAARVLAWPNVSQRGLDSDPRAEAWWARDVVAFEVVDWQRTFGPALSTPDGATDEARRGAARFGEDCISCHRLRGTGGERGPELTTVAARIRAAPFAALLAHHPGLSDHPSDEPRTQQASELWTFLRAVATATAVGAKPEEPELTAERGTRSPDSP